MASKPKYKKSKENNDLIDLGGRPEHEFSERIAGKLEAAITYGIPQEDLAAYIGVSLPTLKKHYKEIFKNCKEDRHRSVKAALHYQATKLNIPASTIFYLKTQCEEFQEKTALLDDESKGEFLMAIAKQLNANKVTE